MEGVMVIDRKTNKFVKAEIHPYADGELTFENAIFRRITVTQENEVVADGQLMNESAIVNAKKWVEGLEEAFKIAREA
jgi:hypothetical protein